MSVEAPEILFCDEVMQLAALGDLFVERWTGTGSADYLRTLVRVHDEYVRARAPAKTFFLVHITTPTITLPDAAGREMVKEHVRVIDGHIAACVIVLTAKGFSASVFHAILSTATMVRRSKYPYRVSRDLDDAFRWFTVHRSPRSSSVDTAEELASAYAALEERFADSARAARARQA